jgi:hypothetical protein
MKFSFDPSKVFNPFLAFFFDKQNNLPYNFDYNSLMSTTRSTHCFFREKRLILCFLSINELIYNIYKILIMKKKRLTRC